jgi:sulfide:quinone oxidoreductase
MVDIAQIDDKTFVAGQILLEDMPAIAARGIRVIVNNRPDGEALHQPSAQAIQDAARVLGMRVVNLAFIPATLTSEAVAQFAAILRDEPGPILAFCRTGNRSSMIWGAARIALGASMDDVLDAADEAGYDLSPAAGLLNKLGRMATAKA